MPKKGSRRRSDVRRQSKDRYQTKEVRGITADSNDDFTIEAVHGVENNAGKDMEAVAVVKVLY